MKYYFSETFLKSFFSGAFHSIALVFLSQVVFAQIHSSHESAKGVNEDFPSRRSVLTKSLTDSGLINKEMHFLQITLPPGATDTVSHRHPCEIFLYIQEGELEYREGKNESVIFRKGEILHEVPNNLHTLHRNPSKNEPTKLLIVFLYTKGKELYIREYPEVKN